MLMALTQLNVENLVNECRSCSSYWMQTFMDDILQGAAQPVDRKHSDHNICITTVYIAG